MSTSTGRIDIYRRIHKAIRACICETLLRVGRLDSFDAREVAAVLVQVRAMAAFCQSHLKHEDEFVHPAMEARFPWSAKATADEHDHHNYACRRIVALADAIAHALPAERVALVKQLYQYIALFLAESLVHMNAEETDNNTLLWASHSDQELLAIEHAIVASLTPEEKALSLRWMLPALTPAERLALLEGMRAGVPAAFFDAMLGGVKTFLAPADWRKLDQGLHGEQLLAA